MLWGIKRTSSIKSEKHRIPSYPLITQRFSIWATFSWVGSFGKQICLGDKWIGQLVSNLISFQAIPILSFTVTVHLINWRRVDEWQSFMWKLNSRNLDECRIASSGDRKRDKFFLRSDDRLTQQLGFCSLQHFSPVTRSLFDFISPPC